MRILVFGNTSFIGTNLTYFLEDEFNIQGISLRDTQWKSQMLTSEVFINLVGKAHDHSGTGTEYDYHFANVALAQQIFEAFIISEAKLFIHISSIAAIEEFESLLPLDESHDSRPVSWYGKSKREAEKWLLAQELPPGKKLIILRPPMVHGPGDKGNLKLLYKFVSKGIPYPLLAFHNQRSFLSINNFTFFIQEIIEKSEALVSGIYHIADDEAVSTREIIEIISIEKGKKVSKLVLPKFLINSIALIGDVLPLPLNSKKLKKLTSSLTVSNTKIKSALGIEKLPLTAEEGLIKTIKSFKK